MSTKLDYSQVIPAVYDEATDSLKVTSLGSSILNEAYDYQSLTYVASGNGVGEIETVTYKTGGASGTVVAVLTMTYDGSNRLSTVTKS